MERVLEGHCLGRQALGCAWLLAFAIMRTTAEQLDFAFEIFDPMDSSPRVSYVVILVSYWTALTLNRSLAFLDLTGYPLSWRNQTD